MKLLYTYLLSLLFCQCFGQDLCLSNSYVKGDFDLSNSSICLPQNLTVTDNSGATNIKYVFNYQGEGIDEVGAISFSNNTFNYASLATKPEIFTVLQIGTLNGKTSIACKNVSVRPSNVAVYSYTPCNTTNSLVVGIPQHVLNDFDSYEIAVNNNISTVLPGQLPYQNSFATTLPAQIKVTGQYSNPAKSCTNPVVSSTATAYLLVPGGVDRPFNPNISELKLETPSKVSLSFTGAYHNSSSNDEQYKLYTYLSGTLPRPSDVTISNIVPGKYNLSIADSTKSYCFYVQRQRNLCGVTEFSTEICTIPLKSVKFDPYRYTLDWVKYPNSIFGIPSNFINNINLTQQIERTENLLSPNSIPVSSNSFSYTDNTIDCSKKYCYRVKAKTSGMISFLKYEAQSSSNLICVDRSSFVATAPENLFVTSSLDNQTSVHFDNTPLWPIDVNRWILHKFESNEFVKIDSVLHPADFILDKEIAKAPGLFKISYVDKCESKSILSDSLSSIFLSFKNPADLSWNKEIPFASSDIDHYEVEYLEENGVGIKKSEKESRNFHTADLKDYNDTAKFRIKVISVNSPNLVSYSNIIKLEVPSTLSLPNIFTPNGDTQNDIFAVKGKVNDITIFNLTIYNRFGETIFNITNPTEGWDGNIKGKKAPSGVYFYKMVVYMANGEYLNKHGTIDIIH